MKTAVYAARGVSILALLGAIGTLLTAVSTSNIPAAIQAVAVLAGLLLPSASGSLAVVLQALLNRLQPPSPPTPPAPHA